jgi:hypothetical protein
MLPKYHLILGHPSISSFKLPFYSKDPSSKFILDSSKEFIQNQVLFLIGIFSSRTYNGWDFYIIRRNLKLKDHSLSATAYIAYRILTFFSLRFFVLLLGDHDHTMYAYARTNNKNYIYIYMCSYTTFWLNELSNGLLLCVSNCFYHILLYAVMFIIVKVVHHILEFRI